MTPPPQKLTKRQKKSLVFRQRGKSKNYDVPVFESLETAHTRPHAVEGNVEVSETASASFEDLDVEMERGMAEDFAERQQGVTEIKGSRKRKRRDIDVESHERPQKDQGMGGDSSKRRKVTEDKREMKARQRFILFVGTSSVSNPWFPLLSYYFPGNLKYTTSVEALKTHFSSCDSLPTIRLLKPKSTTTTKSKGYAFLEFADRNSLQQALKLHHSELEGRKINVELTAGGGGKGEKRLQKVKERNKQLHGQRVTSLLLTNR
jgi:nucleolar protein 6